MNDPRIHTRNLPRRISEVIAANAAAAREAKRQRDRELLEAAWRRLTMPQREVRPS